MMMNKQNSEEARFVTPDEISAEEIRRFEVPGIAPHQAKSLFWRYVFAVQVAKYAIAHAREHNPEGKLPESIKTVRKL
jgi:hypothetical protein